MKKIIVALAICLSTICLSSAAALAGEKPVYKPFPVAQISHAQWDSYRQQVFSAYGASLRSFPEEHLEILQASDNVMHFAFTTAGHAAHPAWITRSAREGSVDQIGYFAGQEEPFAKLFQSYLDLTKRTLEALPAEPADAGSKVGAGSDGHGP